MLYKKIIFSALLAIQTGAFAQSSAVDSIFSRFSRQKDVTSINISRPMFGMLGKLSLKDADIEDMKPLLDKIKSLKILMVEQPAAQVKDAILSSVKNLHYQQLMTVNNDGDEIKFLSGNAENGLLHNVLLHINSAEENIFMLLEGDMTIDDLNRFSSEAQKSDKAKSVSEANFERKVAAFHGIVAESGANVVFTQGSPQKITVDADQDRQRFVKTVVEDDILKIKVERPSGKNKNNFEKLKIMVTAPDINTISLDSGSLFSTQNTLNTKDLVVRLDSGSSLKGKFEVKNMAVSLDSGSALKIETNSKNFALNADSGSAATVTGSAENSAVVLDSGSACNMLDFDAINVSAKLDSGSSARVSVSRSLTASVESGASLSYRGNPTEIITKKEPFSGSITHLEK